MIRSASFTVGRVVRWIRRKQTTQPTLQTEAKNDYIFAIFSFFYVGMWQIRCIQRNRGARRAVFRRRRLLQLDGLVVLLVRTRQQERITCHYDARL